MERVSGWGRTAATVAVVERPSDRTAARMVMEKHESRGLAFRGLGRSYGDAAQSAGGTIVETLALDRVLHFDPVSGVVTAEAGISIDALLRRMVPQGWFVPVTPGTRFVTLGGALAADVHGKNHHRDGSFSRHVVEIELVTPDGTIHRLSPSDDLFWATVGGMGLTGLITEVSLTLVPISTSFMDVHTERAEDLAAVMAALERTDQNHRYTVAWIDCLSRGRGLGRGVVTSGDHLSREHLPGRFAASPLSFEPSARFRSPETVPPGLLNHMTVRAFNEIWFRRAPAHPSRSVQHSASFFHPLDGVRDWNRIYGPSGFVQYQFVIPFGAEDALFDVVRHLAAAGATSFLAVLKRFGMGGPGLLSFPMPGWTLALDLPVRPGIGRLFDDLDAIVESANGRLYLAKDGRMPRRMLRSGYPGLDRFSEVRRRVDPDGVLLSDQARRLDL